MSTCGDRLTLLQLLADDAHPLELRWFTGSGASKAFFVDPVEADAHSDRLTRAGYETFVGVLPRLGADGERQRQYAPSSVLFTDHDTERSVAKLDLFQPPPGVVVLSGGLDGFTAKRHAYWPLEQRVGAEEIGRHLRRLATHLEADMASTEPARILRLPGSVNRKTGIVARVARLCDDRYALDDVVGELPDVRPHRVSRAGNNTVARTVPVHERHAALVSLLGVMRKWGACDKVLVATALAFCEHQCATDPAVPLDITHAERTARDVARRYPAGPACTWGMRR
jgi:hypothetical protein